MSDALKRIEKGIEKLATQQEEICKRLERLEQIRGVAAASGASRREVLAFLDRFRAAESLGEASTGAWVEVCENACLRGGLRVVQQREGFHARLLEARLRALGGEPRAEIPAERVEKVLAATGSRERSDARKLLAATRQSPDIDAAVAPILDLAERLDDDPETQSLLRNIAADERATLEFLHDACRQLNAA